jgi:hypothetical protein
MNRGDEEAQEKKALREALGEKAENEKAERNYAELEEGEDE